jgi:hypothetical protein
MPLPVLIVVHAETPSANWGLLCARKDAPVRELEALIIRTFSPGAHSGPAGVEIDLAALTGTGRPGNRRVAPYRPARRSERVLQRQLNLARRIRLRDCAEGAG